MTNKKTDGILAIDPIESFSENDEDIISTLVGITGPKLEIALSTFLVRKNTNILFENKDEEFSGNIDKKHTFKQFENKNKLNKFAPENDCKLNEEDEDEEN